MPDTDCPTAHSRGCVPIPFFTTASLSPPQDPLRYLRFLRSLRAKKIFVHFVFFDVYFRKKIERTYFIIERRGRKGAKDKGKPSSLGREQRSTKGCANFCTLLRSQRFPVPLQSLRQPLRPLQTSKPRVALRWPLLPGIDHLRVSVLSAFKNWDLRAKEWKKYFLTKKSPHTARAGC